MWPTLLLVGTADDPGRRDRHLARRPGRLEPRRQVRQDLDRRVAHALLDAGVVARAAADRRRSRWASARSPGSSRPAACTPSTSTRARSRASSTPCLAPGPARGHADPGLPGRLRADHAQLAARRAGRGLPDDRPRQGPARRPGAQPARRPQRAAAHHHGRRAQPRLRGDRRDHHRDRLLDPGAGPAGDRGPARARLLGAAGHASWSPRSASSSPTWPPTWSTACSTRGCGHERRPPRRPPVSARALARRRRREAWRRGWAHVPQPPGRPDRPGRAGGRSCCSPSSRRCIAPAEGLEVTKATGGVLEPPSGEYWLGTDDKGRSVLTLLIWGARISLFVGPGRDGDLDGDRHADRADVRLLRGLDRRDPVPADRVVPGDPVPAAGHRDGHRARPVAAQHRDRDRGDVAGRAPPC